MKSIRKPLLTLVFLFSTLFIFNAIADGPLDSPPPPPGGGHGGGGNPQGAPIDGGLGILISLGVGYGALRLKKHGKWKQQLTHPDNDKPTDGLS